MEESSGKDIIFVLFILTVMVLTAVYFSVPERVVFMDNQVNWWTEFWDFFITLGA